jgi:copper homeostasis protein
VLTLEICVQGIESALAAGLGGADRIELCEDLAVGGVTPSAGTIAVACRNLSIPVHVLIRPRGGGFTYSDVELEVMERDIAMAKVLGAAGVVLGVLGPDGTVDRDRTARLIAAARPLSVTFHKALDETPDPAEALEALIALGVDRVLTAGGSVSARDGLDQIAALDWLAAGRIAVMAGGGVRLPDIPMLARERLKEVHVGSAACSEGRTDAGKVRELVAAARSLAS